ncbi:hypothetical protein Pfo_031652, partial [Paulownia fortunei]
MTADLGNEKRALRAELRQRRRTRTTTERDTDTTALTSTLQRFVEERQLRSLALYLSAPDEPDVRPFLRWAQEHGVRVLLPITREDGLARLGASTTGSPNTRACTACRGRRRGALPARARGRRRDPHPGGGGRARRMPDGLGPRLLRQDPRVDGEPAARLCCDLRRGVPRRRSRARPTTNPSTASSRRRASSLPELGAPSAAVRCARCSRRSASPSTAAASTAPTRGRRRRPRVVGVVLVVLAVVEHAGEGGAEEEPSRSRPRPAPPDEGSSPSVRWGLLDTEGGSREGLQGVPAPRNVIDLAVAVVIGAAFTAIVTAIVNSLINPLIGAVFNAS